MRFETRTSSAERSQQETYLGFTLIYISSEWKPAALIGHSSENVIQVYAFLMRVISCRQLRLESCAMSVP